MGKQKKILLFALLVTLCGTNTYANEKHANEKALNYSQRANSEVKEFADLFNQYKKNFKKYTKVLDNLSSEEYNTAMAQLSGGVHGYTVDFAAINSRTLSNTMLNRALTRDYMKARPVNSWTQDIIYMDNSHKLGGLMNVNYDEHGILGVSERQVMPNGKVGLIYGGSNGKAKFDDGKSGNVTLDGTYAGGYYQHEFDDKWGLNSRAMFVYTHNRVKRNLNFGNINEEFKSNYPTYTVGIGSSLIYTLKDNKYNKAHFYTGFDINRIMQGNINENEEFPNGKVPNTAIKNLGDPKEKTYWSIVPSVGFLAENTGYILDKKYRIGASVSWETEVGNIKDGKRLNMKGLYNGNAEYKVETGKRENIFSYSVFGALDVTENLAVNAKYTSLFSEEYDADMIGAGFEYKFDTMSRNRVFGPMLYGVENHRIFSDRWGGTFSIMMESEDDSDRSYYKGSEFIGAGDYASSTTYKPKFTLSLNDKKTNWSYYFEGYYRNNSMIQGLKGNEAKRSASRIHGEARWTDTYSKGKYGMYFGYRNEIANQPSRYSYNNYTRKRRGVHQLRLTPNFTYNFGHGFMLNSKTTGIFEYNYIGTREHQMDFLMENEHGIIYSGFMPQWKIAMNYFREDRWYDHHQGTRRYQLNQFRPSITYYFGNGGSFKFDVRVPLGNGQFNQNKNHHKVGKEFYETRYGFNYYQPIGTGLTLNVGGTFLNMKYKSQDGKITKNYSFRPNVGFSYSF